MPPKRKTNASPTSEPSDEKKGTATIEIDSDNDESDGGHIDSEDSGRGGGSKKAKQIPRSSKQQEKNASKPKV